ncbi:MAG: hypothetical protein JRH07_16340, partial [Deltaproteobacteria bacterium]|nr:hypothetical protein [Deltaproteobacteria bacterium]
LHRLMRKDAVNGKSVLFTKGDALVCLDGPIRPEQVLGKVTAIKKGSWTLDLNRPWGEVINLVFALFQRWAVSRWMIYLGRRGVRSLVGGSRLFRLFGLARPWGRAENRGCQNSTLQ